MSAFHSLTTGAALEWDLSAFVLGSPPQEAFPFLLLKGPSVHALMLSLFPFRFVVVGTTLTVNVVPACLLEGQHLIASWKKMHLLLSYLIYHCSLPVLLSFPLNVFAFFSSLLLCLLLSYKNILPFHSILLSHIILRLSPFFSSFSTVFHCFSSFSSSTHPYPCCFFSSLAPSVMQ